jgi:transcriptional regulator with XRE-family HTH domain
MARKRTSVARSPEYELLGRNLTTARSNLGLSQAEAAEKIGISQGTYSGYETGTRRIKLNMVKRIAEAYGVTVDWLIGTEELIKAIPRPELTLSDIEYDLVVKFRELSDAEKAIVLRSVGVIQ